MGMKGTAYGINAFVVSACLWCCAYGFIYGLVYGVRWGYLPLCVYVCVCVCVCVHVYMFKLLTVCRLGGLTSYTCLVCAGVSVG